MESAEDTYTSSQRETSFESTSAPDPKRRQSRFARWFKVLAVVLVVACLAGGGFAYTRLSRNTPTHQTSWCDSTGYGHPTGLGSTNLVAISPSNMWAFGDTPQTYQGPNSNFSILLAPRFEHWDGSQWSVVASPDTSPLLSSLQDKFTGQTVNVVALQSLTAISADDMWAVGSISVSDNSTSKSFGRALIEHWDGRLWQVVASPDIDPQERSSLNSVVAISASDIWAIGSAGPSPLVEHWDGSQWSLIQLPPSLLVASLEGVTATSAHDVWAVGHTSNNTPVAIHWDGQSWSAATLPPDLNSGDFSFVKEISAHDMWVAGPIPSSSSGSSQPTVAHWDGQHWSRIEHVNGVSTGSAFWGIAANDSNNVWVVGSTRDHVFHHTNVTRPLIEHWNGQSWSQVAFPGVSYGEITGVSIAGGKVWVIGDQTDSTGQSDRGFIETMC